MAHLDDIDCWLIRTNAEQHCAMLWNAVRGDIEIKLGSGRFRSILWNWFYLPRSVPSPMFLNNSKPVTDPVLIRLINQAVETIKETKETSKIFRIRYSVSVMPLQAYMREKGLI